jgi:hypothetical protein
MSFRIDLSPKEGIFIYLVVINDQINVNFEESDSSNKILAAQMRDKFTHLLYAHASLEHRQPVVRGEDAEHVKRHHVITEETQQIHMHYSFDQDVTPQLLQHFFSQLLLAQTSPDHYDDEFVTENEVNEILQAFGTFYADFKGSKFEKEFLEERALTKQEKDSLVEQAKQNPRDHLSKRDVSELKKCGFTSTEIPKPSEQPRTQPISKDLDLLIALLSKTGFGFFPNQPGDQNQNPDPSSSFRFK